MSYTDPTRPGANGNDEPSVLELLGFGAPSAPGSAPAAQAPASSNLPPHARAAITPAQAGSRRAQRELERKPPSGSAARRIRAIEKSHRKAARKLPRGARVAVATTAASRPTRGTSRARSIGSRVLSVSAMIFAGALAVGMSVPANAFNNGSDDVVLTQAADQSVQQSQQQDNQSMAADSTVVAGASAARDAYTVTSWADMLRLQYGTRDYAYELGDPNGPIRWPFPYAVPISSGFGERAAPCRGCSSLHMGLDFTPGGGAPIYAVADGTVVLHDDELGGFGNHVIIDHGDLLGNGTNIQTLYAHMQTSSSPLVVGETVHVGDFIGLVGMTGAATGNHLHFEVHVNESPVDPFAWLQANT
jgi:murein DD-endopeptidase MepM/ murein hydrolase activator NlpD